MLEVRSILFDTGYRTLEDIVENEVLKMYKCEQCGRMSKKKIRYGGYTLCSKHMHQLQKYKKFLDDNPRSSQDPNDIVVNGDIAVVGLYNRQSERIAEFIIDAEDVDKIKHYRWRLSYGRVVTGNHTNTHPTTYLTHILLGLKETGYENVIDHIDGDPLNNRKSNLRRCTQGENTLNKARCSNNTSGFIGVHPDNRKSRNAHWCAEIRKQNKRYHIGQYVLIEEAVYARFIAETILFKEFRNTNDDKIKQELFDKIPQKRKEEIAKYVLSKIPSD